MSMLKNFWTPSSVFCSFLLLWFVTYPLNFYLIRYLGVELQLPITYGNDELLLALILSIISLLIFMFFVMKTSEYHLKLDLPSSSNASVLVISIIPIFFFVNFIIKVNVFDLGVRQLIDATALRNNSTLYFFFLDLITPYTVMFISVYRARSKNEWFIYFSMIIVLLLFSFMLGQFFYSRRYVALPVISLLTHFAIQKNKKRFLILITASAIFLAPLLNEIRHITSNSQPQLNSSIDTKSKKRIDGAPLRRPSMFFQSISSSYEGVGHLAEYINNSGLGNFIFGNDYGMSNVFNLGLSNIPRFIWRSKPILVGSVYQQSIIYPETAKNPISMSTFPLGFIVDFLFGLGIFGLLLFSAFFATFFRLLDESLEIDSKSFNYFVGIFCFSQLFNFFRGGTAFIGNLFHPLILILILLISEKALTFLFKNKFN